MHEKTNIILKNNIKKLLGLANISVRDLERRSGLKCSAIQNILIGRSKNPTIKIVQSVAQELNCSIDSLINDSKVAQLPGFMQPKKIKLVKGVWNGKLFVDTSILVHTIFVQKQINPTNEKALLCINEIYNYSTNTSNNGPDLKFAEWIIERFLSEKQ